MSTLRARWILCTCLLLAAFWTHCSRESGASRPASPEKGDMNSALTRATLESTMHVKLPQSARILNFIAQSGLDDSAFAKLEMPRDDMQAFTGASPFTRTAFRADRVFTVRTIGFDWWDDVQLSNFLSGQVELAGAEYLAMTWVRPSEPTATVLLEWGER